MAINKRNRTRPERNKPEGDGYLCLRALLGRWLVKDGRDLPWRRTRDPYAVLVSEFMLQQTPVDLVGGYFESWMQRYPDFNSLAAAPEADVFQSWQGLGSASRARILHKAAKQVVADHGGTMPNDLEAIQQLPGLDRYTAGVVATVAFGEPTPIVDANIARVLARLQNSHVPIDSVGGQKALWNLAAKMQPKKGGGGAFNEALMELGAMVCLPGRPKCPACPVCGLCKAKNPERLPLSEPASKKPPVKKVSSRLIEKAPPLPDKKSVLVGSASAS